MIVEKFLNYSFQESALWVVFIFEKILLQMQGEDGDPIQARVVVNGYQMDTPKFNQKTDPTITIQHISKKQFTHARTGGRTSTSITKMSRPKFGINVTGDQGRIYNLWFYHYYNGSPQFIEWNQEYTESYKFCVPEWGMDEDVIPNGNDDYGLGQSWLISFLHTLDYSSSPDNLIDIEIPEDAIIAEKA